MSGQGQKILVVEDEAAVLENIVELLGAEGYLVTGARDGEEALFQLQSERPGLILCDVRMPRLNGLGLLARISQDFSLASIPFIFLTALKERSDLRTAMELGADDYISKPFSRQELLGAIQRRLKKHEALRTDARQSVDSFNKNLLRTLPLEILQLLNLIKGQSNLLIKTNGQVGTEEVVQIGEKISLAAERLSRSAANYILLSRLNSSPVDENEAVSHLQQIAVKKGIEEIATSTAWQQKRSNDLNLDLEDGLVTIDESSFQCIIEELLANALDRTSPGSPVSLSARVDHAQNLLKVIVADRGQDFLPAQINMLDLSDLDRMDEFVGIRIGLILARKLVMLHKGNFEIKSEPGEGNSIEVVLPLSSEYTK
jgi:two-component system sensor histidine kinase/response regulator